MKTQIKKVKIDEHIRSTKKGNSEAAMPRKRGRPRKDHGGDAGAGKLQSTEGTSAPFSTINGSEISQDKQPVTLPEIKPVYDTTEEAKGFLRAPFDIAAGITGIPKLALYPSQIDALAPSFKVVYDKRIAPYMGENADLIAFGMVFAGIVFEKVQVFKEETQKEKPKESQSTNSVPSIVTEHKQ